MGNPQENAKGRCYSMIDILMATYNGEKYLCEQLDSILRQSNKNWRLIIRDDCSTDNTVTIIQEYQAQYPDKVVLIQADSPSGSAQNNFFQLIKYWQQHGDANYIMFADQDDVWMQNKIQRTLHHMQMLEQHYGRNIPLLVHTDLMVVDTELNVINPSMFAMQNMDANRNQLNHILVQNIVTGCTMMVNKPLLDMVAEIPQHAIMHDMWLALIAAAFGQIDFVDEAAILYRQHGNNANGAKNVRTLRYFLWKLIGAKEIHHGLIKQYRQADELLNLYGTMLDEQQQNMLQAYGAMESYNIMQKYRVLKNYKLYKKGLIRKLGQILI